MSLAGIDAKDIRIRRIGPVTRFKPPERFELPTPWFVARCSPPLSYGGELLRSQSTTGTTEAASHHSPGSRVRLTL